MNALPSLIQQTAELSESVTRPIPGSRKIHVPAAAPTSACRCARSRSTDTPAMFGAEKNPPFPLYDTSGPYTDPADADRPVAGLPAAAGTLDRRARRYAALRRFHLRVHAAPAPATRKLADVRFPQPPKPRAPKPAPTSPRCITRAAASSRRRWNTSPSARTSRSRAMPRSAAAQAASRRRRSARRSRSSITPEFVRDEVARGRAIIPANINHPEASR